MTDTTVVQRRRARAPRRPTGPRLHIFEFAFLARRGYANHITVLVRNRSTWSAAFGPAYTEARRRGDDPWLLSVRTVPASRATPRLDALCRRLTSFASFLTLLTAAGGYKPSIRLDLAGRDGLALARAYDRTQARWGDPRRAFVTGDPRPRQRARQMP